MEEVWAQVPASICVITGRLQINIVNRGNIKIIFMLMLHLS